MTKQEKERKIKLLTLILLVENERFKKTNFDNHFKTIAFALEYMKWVVELAKVSKQKTFESGGISHVGNNVRKEVYISKPTNRIKTIPKIAYPNINNSNNK